MKGKIIIHNSATRTPPWLHFMAPHICGLRGMNEPAVSMMVIWKEGGRMLKRGNGWTHSCANLIRSPQRRLKAENYILALSWNLPVSLGNSGHQQYPSDHQNPLPSPPCSGHCSVLSFLCLLPFTYCIWSSFGGHSSLCAINFSLTMVLVNNCLADSPTRCPCPLPFSCQNLGRLVHQPVGHLVKWLTRLLGKQAG